MFSFTSTALTGKLINDDAGGAGGVGAVLLEDDGAAFVYATADGGKQYTEGSVINASGGVQADISNFQGSFVVSLYNGNHPRSARPRSRAAPRHVELRASCASKDRMGSPALAPIRRQKMVEAAVGDNFFDESRARRNEP